MDELGTPSGKAQEATPLVGRELAGPLALLVLYAFVAYCFSPFRMSAGAGGVYVEYGGVMAMGAVALQFFVVLLWGTLSCLPLVWRLPGTIVSIVLLACCLTSGAERMEQLLFFGIPFATVAAVLLVLRSRYRWRMVHGAPDDSRRSNPEAISIRYFLAWTTIAALVLVILRALEAFSGAMPTTWPPPSEVIASAFLFLSIFVPSLLVGCHVLRAQSHWRVSLAYAGAGLLLGGLLASLILILMSWPFTIPTFHEGVAKMFLFSAGSMTTMLYSSFWLRWTGHRLIRL